jgi:hypothetical protein
MDARFRNDLRNWFAEVGILYLAVVALVGLLFLVKGLQPLFSSSPSFSKRVAAQELPRHQGRVAPE